MNDAETCRQRLQRPDGLAACRSWWAPSPPSPASVPWPPLAYEDRIFTLTPSGTPPTMSSISGKDNVFQMCFTDPNQGSGLRPVHRPRRASASEGRHHLQKRRSYTPPASRDSLRRQRPRPWAWRWSARAPLPPTPARPTSPSSSLGAQSRRRRPGVPAHLLSARLRDSEPGQRHGLRPHLLRRGRHGRHPDRRRALTPLWLRASCLLTPFSADAERRDDRQNFVTKYQERSTARSPTSLPPTPMTAVYTLQA